MTGTRNAAELAAGARAWIAYVPEPDRLRTLLQGLAEIAESASAAADAERDTVLRVRRALSNHPRCDVRPDEDAISCGWKRAVRDVQRAIDDHQPLDSADAENERLHRDLSMERDEHTRIVEMLEIALQDAAVVLGIDEHDLGDTDVMEKLASAAERARTERSPAALDPILDETREEPRDV